MRSFFCIEAVVAKLVRQHEDHQQAHRHCQCEAEDVDEGECFVLEDVAKGNFDVVFQHGRSRFSRLAVIIMPTRDWTRNEDSVLQFVRK